MGRPTSSSCCSASRNRRLGLVCLLLLAGCGGGEQTGSKAGAASDTAPSADLQQRQPAEKPAPARCAPSLTPELDRESIIAALARAEPDTAKLDSLKDRAGRAFDAAAERLCRSGKLDPRLLRPFRTLIIQNGSGATEATFYEDPHEFSSADLIFQWTFAEAGLGVPQSEDVEAGLLCWARPDLPDCADRQP